MARFVEHDARRREILEKALDVFIEEGFENTTFQKIADRAAIRRTTLYQYFKDKRDLFHFSIKQFMKEIENELTLLNKNPLSTVEKLIKIMHISLKKLEENRRLLTVIFNFFVQNQNKAYKPEDYVRRRTIRFRRMINNIIIDGINSGDIRPVNIQAVNEMLFMLIKGAICELAVFKRKSILYFTAHIELCLKELLA